MKFDGGPFDGAELDTPHDMFPKSQMNLSDFILTVADNAGCIEWANRVTIHTADGDHEYEFDSRRVWHESTETHMAYDDEEWYLRYVGKRN